MYVTHLENHISRSQNFDGHLGKHESIQGKDWQVNLCDVDDETRAHVQYGNLKVDWITILQKIQRNN